MAYYTSRLGTTAASIEAAQTPAAVSGEPLPSGLTGDTQGLADLRPGHVALAQRVDMLAEEIARRIGDCRTTRELIEQFSVRPLVPRRLRRGGHFASEAFIADTDAFIADKNGRPGDQRFDAVGIFATK